VCRPCRNRRRICRPWAAGGDRTSGGERDLRCCLPSRKSRGVHPNRSAHLRFTRKRGPGGGSISLDATSWEKHRQSAKASKCVSSAHLEATPVWRYSSSFPNGGRNLYPVGRLGTPKALGPSRSAVSRQSHRFALVDLLPAFGCPRAHIRYRGTCPPSWHRECRSQHPSTPIHTFEAPFNPRHENQTSAKYHWFEPCRSKLSHKLLKQKSQGRVVAMRHGEPGATPMCRSLTTDADAATTLPQGSNTLALRMAPSRSGTKVGDVLIPSFPRCYVVGLAICLYMPQSALWPHTSNSRQ